MATNYYDTLAIPRAASLDDIKKAYKKAALVHHPDKGGDPEEFKRVSAAVAILSDARKRREYDSTLLQARSRDGLSAVDIAAQSDKLRSTELHPQGRFSVYQPDLSGWFAQPPHAQQFAQPSTQGASAFEAKLTAKPPTPPRPSRSAVEIPAKPSSLSVMELKALLVALGIHCEGSCEKDKLLEKLKSREAGNVIPRGKLGGTGKSSTLQRPSGVHGERSNTPPRKVRAGIGAGAPAKSPIKCTKESVSLRRSAQTIFVNEKKRTATDSMSARRVRAKVQPSTPLNESQVWDEVGEASQPVSGSEGQAVQAANMQGVGVCVTRHPTIRRMGSAHLRMCAAAAEEARRMADQAKRKVQEEAEVVLQASAKAAAAKQRAESKLCSVIDRIRLRLHKPSEGVSGMVSSSTL